MVLPTNHNLNTAASNPNLSSQKEPFSSTEADQTSFSKTSGELPRPPKEPINIEKHLKEWNLDSNLFSSQKEPFSSTEADQASFSKTSGELPRPPKEPINIEKHLKEWNLDPITPKLERDPYGHETADSNPPTPASTSSEDSELPLGASFDVFKG